jgi:hypothetical protein
MLSIILFIAYLLEFENVQTEIWGIITLPAVLYECETWSLTFREENTDGGFFNTWCWEESLDLRETK